MFVIRDPAAEQQMMVAFVREQVERVERRRARGDRDQPPNPARPTRGGHRRDAEPAAGDPDEREKRDLGQPSSRMQLAERDHLRLDSAREHAAGIQCGVHAVLARMNQSHV
jgi:hypothetical protein